DAGDDVTVECAGPDGTTVQLDGSGSSDVDGQALTFTWTSPSFPSGVTLSGTTPVVTTPPLPLGTHVITLTVADGVDGSAPDEVVVTVRDTTPPVLQLGGTALSLWPPNHVFESLDVSSFVVAASDSCDAAIDRDAAHFSAATSDEPENGTGDG